MKQKIFTVLAAALLLMGATGCTKGEDNPSSTDMRLQEQDLIGLWYDEYEYADVTETGVPFSRVLLAVDVEADHSGCIYLGVFDESSDEPLAVYGGPDEAGFIWQILPDGSVVLTDPATSESRVVTRADNGGNFGKAMTNVANTSVTVADGSVTVTNGNYSGELAKADAQKKAEIEQKMAAAISYEWLTNATANDIGKVVCEAGHLHKAKQATKTQIISSHAAELISSLKIMTPPLRITTPPSNSTKIASLPIIIAAKPTLSLRITRTPLTISASQSNFRPTTA